MGHDGIGGQRPAPRRRLAPRDGGKDPGDRRRLRRQARIATAHDGPRGRVSVILCGRLRPAWPSSGLTPRMEPGFPCPWGVSKIHAPLGLWPYNPGGAAVPEGTAMSVSQPEAEVISRRKHPRRRTNAPGTPCILENVSDGGAGLRFETNILLPPVFTLSVPAERVDRRCEVMWRDGYRVGVSFV